ncbi:DUF6708 domain-containing protein [Entomohabitans teleogrylli]|uniref:DUF6708 domain-containing protein n=1 Tax=Entomohabitans teleogrylli TaxID=1384589 RepID=UPI0008FC526F|nr:DUF6708 domain-containing protein [Entomohabitans teleogrylli]
MPSKYTPQLSHWLQDLNKWTNSAPVRRVLNTNNDSAQKLEHNGTLLFVNDDYCEISRRRPNERYRHLIHLILTGLLALVVVSFTLFFVCTGGVEESVKIYSGTDSRDKNTWTLMLFSVCLLLVVGLTSFNYFLFAPKDYPLRFNRKTGKVYVYDYVNLQVWQLGDSIKAMFTFPFFLPTRPVQKVFDWQDVQGVETYFSARVKGAPYTSRCLYGVVCAPETTQMVDKFLLSVSGNELSSHPYRQWIWICSYMAFNDDHLDKTLVNRDNFWGRKVVWSDEFARESTRSAQASVRQGAARTCVSRDDGSSR